MSLSKKVSLSLAFLMVLISVAACSSGNVPSSASIKGAADFSKSNNVKIVQGVNQDHIYVDVGNGKKTGAAITVKVDLNSFTTKSFSGTTKKVDADVDSETFWLIEAPTGVKPTGNLPYLSITSTALGSGGGQHTATFTNVPDNTIPAVGTNSYYIAAAAFDSGSLNITDTTSGLMVSGNPAIISTSGGDGRTITLPGTGSINVSSGRISLGAEQSDLGIILKLQDTTGATITGTTTVQNGVTTPAGIGTSVL